MAAISGFVRGFGFIRELQIHEFSHNPFLLIDCEIQENVKYANGYDVVAITEVMHFSSIWN